MKARFRVTRRGDRDGMFYSKDTLTGERVSLETKDRSEAERLVFHLNEAQKNNSINYRIGMNYLSASDPEYATRTWKFVMDDNCRVSLLNPPGRNTLWPSRASGQCPGILLLGNWDPGKAIFLSFAFVLLSHRTFTVRIDVSFIRAAG